MRRGSSRYRWRRDDRHQLLISVSKTQEKARLKSLAFSRFEELPTPSAAIFIAASLSRLAE
jgi:hypothetical protein